MSEEKQDVAIASFNPRVMLDNIARARRIVQSIRQREAVGSEADELVIHRLIQDIDLLVEITGGLRMAYDNLLSQHNSALQTLGQSSGMKEVYERMLSERETRIVDLEQQLGIRPQSSNG